MIRDMFSAFFCLFLLMFCVLSEATKTAEQENSLEPPKSKQIIAVKDDAFNAKELNIEDLRKASFVSVAGTIVALVQTGKNNGKEERFIKYIEAQEENWGKEVPEGTSTNDELPTGFKWDEKEEKVVLAMVAKDNKIYIFAASKRQPSLPQKSAQDKKWKFKLAVGTINNGGDQIVAKKIKWENQQTPESLNADNFQNKLEDVFPVDASAFLTEEGALVFVVRAKKDSDKRGVFVVAHSKKTETDLEVSFVDATPNCYSSFFSWGTKLFMVPEFCGSTSVKEIPKIQQSANMGNKWTDADGPLATNLNNLQGGKAFFTTTKIGNKRVLLFTKEETGPNVKRGKVSINLFMSNDNCIENLGEIISNVSYVPYGSIVHTKDELFFFAQKLLDNSYKIAVRRLKTQLDRITTTLKESKCVEEKKVPRDPQHDQLNNAGSKEGKEKEKTLDVSQEDHSTPTTPQEDTTQLRESGDNSVHLRAGVAVVLLLLCLLLGL